MVANFGLTMRCSELGGRGGEEAGETPGWSATGRYNASDFARFCSFVMAMEMIKVEDLASQANDDEEE